MDNAFTYEEGVAVCTEASYAYTGKDGTCHASSCTAGIPKGGVVGFKDVTPSNEQAMMEAVAQQPVSVAIEADKSVFQVSVFLCLQQKPRFQPLPPPPPRGCNLTLPPARGVVGYNGRAPPLSLVTWVCCLNKKTVSSCTAAASLTGLAARTWITACWSWAMVKRAAPSTGS